MAKDVKKAAKKAAPAKEAAVEFAYTLADMAKALNMTEVSLRDKCRRLEVPKHKSGKYGWTNQVDFNKAKATLSAGAKGKKEAAKKPAAKKAPAKKAAPKKPVADANASA